MEKDYDTSVQTKNKYGEWVPAIPLPYYGAFNSRKCQCGHKFYSDEKYRGHYALKHILGET